MLIDLQAEIDAYERELFAIENSAEPQATIAISLHTHIEETLDRLRAQKEAKP